MIMKDNEHTYELWFLGDMVGEAQTKNRATLNALLQEGIQMLTDAVAAEPTLNCGEAEIVHRWGEFGQRRSWAETVWSMSIDEYKKGRLI